MITLLKAVNYRLCKLGKHFQRVFVVGRLFCGFHYGLYHMRLRGEIRRSYRKVVHLSSAFLHFFFFFI